MTASFHQRIRAELADIGAQGLTKPERVISSRQGPVIQVGGREVLNFCANNYLGLSDHPRMVEAAKAALDRYGFGMSSVRFICGTQNDHKALEERLSRFLGAEDTILYGSCFDANTGLFETIGQAIIGFFGYGGREAELRAFYDKWGAWFIFLKGLTPIPYKLVTIISGAMAFSLPIFVAASILTRGLRFIIVVGMHMIYA